MKPIKACTKCGIEKEVNKENFNRRYDKGKRHLFRSECKDCYNAYTRGNPRYLRKALIRHARTRALKKGLEFDLKYEDLNYPDYCPVLGIKLKHGYGKGKDRENSPSIDRIDNTKGYTVDNVIIISVLANSIKTSATPEQIIKVGEFYKKLHKEKGITNETH